MTASSDLLVEVVGALRHYGMPQPLRVKRFTVRAGDRFAIGGLDTGAAEALIHLITGASVPEEGTLRVAGRDTRDIATDTEWLASLDRFGIVTARAVLIGKLPIADNLALPLTLSIDPMSAETRAAVEALADLVSLPRARLGAPAATLTPDELVRVHMARALASRPALLLLEQPTAAIADVATKRSLGLALRHAATATGAGWLALTDDQEFVRASGSTRLRLNAATGEMTRDGFWARFGISRRVGD